MIKHSQLNEVPVGYKRTDVGVIPEDWDVCELRDSVHFLDGLRQPVKSGDRAKISGIYPYYGASGIVDYVNDYIFDDELILLGEDGENILSRNLPLAFKVSGKIWVNNHAHVLKPNKNFDIAYLTDFLESLDYSLLNSGTAQPKLNKQACLTIKVVKPPLKEQTAIANALSDVDALISELEKLIAKKQAIKTAAMQRLLTGKTRVQWRMENGELKIIPPDLSDFSTDNSQLTKQSELGEIPVDWEVVELSSVIERFVGGGTPSRSNNEYWGGEIPWVTVKDFATFTPYTAQESITKKGLKYSASNLVPKGTLIISTRMALGKAIIYQVDVAINQDLKGLFCGEHLCTKFLYFWFEANVSQLEELGSGSTVKGLSLPDLRKVKFLLPSKEEQTAIVTILSDMDKEIQALEQRLSKTRQIKQGMMQELLTGRIRLISGELEMESGK